MRFADIVGHEQIKSQLKRMVSSGRLPHALLLWGLPGIGKLALARAFAQYIHCQHPNADGDSCGKCPACIQHASGNFPDMLYSFPTVTNKSTKPSISEDFSEQWSTFIKEYPLAPWNKWLELMGVDNSQPIIRADESNEIIRKLSRSNFLADRKILLLWLPEKLHLAAANKLLKLIEEPEHGNMIIMVSDSPTDILPTIFSRLQRIKVAKPTVQQTAQWVMQYCNISQQAALNVSAVAEAIPQRALDLLEEKSETDEFRELFQELMRRAYSVDVAGLKEWSEKVAALKRERGRRFLLYMRRQLRHNFVSNVHIPSLVSFTPEEMQFSTRFAKFIHSANIEGFLTEVLEADRDLAGNGNAKIIFFDFALHAIRLIKTPEPIQ